MWTSSVTGVSLHWPHGQKLVNWNFFIPRGNHIAMHFHNTSGCQTISHTKRVTSDMWVDTSSWSYCPQGGVERKPGENRWFSGQVTSLRVTSFWSFGPSLDEILWRVKNSHLWSFRLLLGGSCGAELLRIFGQCRHPIQVGTFASSLQWLTRYVY